MFLLTSCNLISSEPSPTHGIVPPSNEQTPIRGTWKATPINKDNEKQEEKSELENFQFSKDFIVLGNLFLKNPTYKMKRVSKEDYLIYYPGDHFDPFSKDDLDIITVIDQDKFFCEILWINSNELVLNMANDHFYLTKISDEVDSLERIMLNYTMSLENDIHSNNEKKTLGENTDEKETMRSGVLIGLRSTDASQAFYRTLWLAAKDGEMYPFLELDGIFFPRRSGFWKLDIIRHTEEEKQEDLLLPHPIQQTQKLKNDLTPSLNALDWLGKTGDLFKYIDYIGNDYVAIEMIGNGKYSYRNEIWKTKKLQILPIDSLPSNRNVKISDLAGEKAEMVMESQLQKMMTDKEITKKQLIKPNDFLNNIGLERRIGHWFFKGRIHYQKEKEDTIFDYTLPLFPPSELIFYDYLSISWTHIKDKIPDALDAFTSPSQDLLIVITKKEIGIYAIENGVFSNTPLKRIPLKENEKVIMAEWALGDYVDNWHQTLKSIKAQ